MNNDNDNDIVYIYTDGSCLGNPGKGGWGVILRYKESYKELFGGYIKSTNNRMELLAVIKALEALKQKSTVVLYTDSKYIHDAIEKKWLNKWQNNNWKTSTKKPVKNQDLWELLADLLKLHSVQFTWVKAHNGNPDNERCDALAKSGAMLDTREEDTNFME